MIFFLVKQVNRLKRPPAPEPEALETPEDVLLLREIRDLLAKEPVRRFRNVIA